MKGRWKIVTAACGAVFCVALLRTCVATSYLIPSSGMENSLYQGERIVVNKWSYGLRLPLMGLWGYKRWGSSPARRDEIVVFNNPANRREPVIDRREVFIGRVIGTPGDTLMVDSLFGAAPREQRAPDQKFLYSYPHRREPQLRTLLTQLSISPGAVLGQDSLSRIRSFSRYEYYLLQQAMPDSCWILPAAGTAPADTLHPLIVPACGKPVRVDRRNITLLRNTLVLHEHRQADIRHDTLWVDGQPMRHVTFCQNYYWIGTNSATNLQDSRLFGFVPQNHLIGRASLIWFSKDQSKGPFTGYRWERMGRAVK